MKPPQKTKGAQTVTKSKYGSRKITIDGVTFDSKKEAARYQQLKLLEHAGKIGELRRQVEFELIPAQFEHPNSFTKSGRGKCIERKCSYIADFVYKVPILEGGEPCIPVVEDTKGYKTPEYIIKRKLMLFVHGIRINEI